MMTIKVITTGDGSKSLFLPDLNETYHSKFGAITESEHVFIQAGYKYISKSVIRILEIGFGTGLNVLLTYLAHLKDNQKIYYETIEKYPLPGNIIDAVNYFKDTGTKEIFKRIHNVTWQEDIALTERFVLHKNRIDLLDYNTDKKFDLVYFDAFAPDKQPEMWTQAIFDKMYKLLDINGILVTYSAKGSVRRTMQAAGFKVERLPGPPGKREMLRAVKSQWQVSSFEELRK